MDQWKQEKSPLRYARVRQAAWALMSSEEHGTCGLEKGGDRYLWEKVAVKKPARKRRHSSLLRGRYRRENSIISHSRVDISV